eukprot:tig00020710_g13364.t1
MASPATRLQLAARCQARLPVSRMGLSAARYTSGSHHCSCGAPTTAGAEAAQCACGQRPTRLRVGAATSLLARASRQLTNSARRFSTARPARAADVIGIDLGTTNSCVAIMEGAAPRVIENEEGERTTPSVVAFADGDGGGGGAARLVGSPAKRQAVMNPLNTFYATKRLIGRTYDDPMTKRDAELVPYKIVRSPAGDAWVADAAGNKYSPSQIGAFVLAKMKATAESHLGRPVREAVVTVPAYFSDAQRQATKDAGRIAGLEVLRIVNEPTAAALAYGLERRGAGTLLVYDLAVPLPALAALLPSPPSPVPLPFPLPPSPSPPSPLFPLPSAPPSPYGVDLSGDRLALQRVREAAEKAKCELSVAAQAEVSIPFVAQGPAGPLHLSARLSRSELERLVAPLIQRTEGPCRACLADAGVAHSDINEVILVGGMTRMPAVQAGVLKGEVKDILLLDVTPLSLGLEVRMHVPRGSQKLSN